MQENQTVTPRRRLLLFGGLLFVAGLVAGLLLGVFGVRHLFFRFRPSPQDMAMKRADRLQKDFNLAADARAKIVVENQRLFSVMSDDFASRHKHMESLLEEHVENIAKLLPNDDARKKWRENFRDYFPPPPPPPPGPKMFPPVRPPGQSVPRD